MTRLAFFRFAEKLLVWTVRLIPAMAVGSLLFVFGGNLRWLGLLGLPLLALAIRGYGLGCGHRGCGLAVGTMPDHWPAP